MAGDMTLQQRVKRVLMAMPGKRGVDIAEPLYDRIFHVANGISQPLWGQPPTPEQMQHMHDHGIHEPAQIKAHYDSYPHPSAPHMTVAEYQAYSQAYDVWRQHR